MTRPDWCPEDVWDETEGARVSYSMPDPDEVRILVARAILAERERCAGIVAENYTMAGGECLDPAIPQIIAAIRTTP